MQPVVLFRVPETALGGSVSAYYQGVLKQMHDAASGRDAQQLRQLIEVHRREAAPEWFKRRVADFEMHLPALEFEVHVAENSSLRLLDQATPLGAPLNFLFTIPPQDQRQVSLLAGGDLDSARFLATISIEEFDCYGSSSVWRSSRLLELPQRLDLSMGKILGLPIALPAIASEGAYLRVSISVDWMPGYLRIDRQRLANGRVQCARLEALVFPQGVESIRRAPLTTLRSALQLGDAEHFNHVYLAALFMPADLRSEAQGMLIQELRLARADLARVCMSALALGAEADLSVDDRLGWLRWWQEAERR